LLLGHDVCAGIETLTKTVEKHPHRSRWGGGDGIGTWGKTRKGNNIGNVKKISNKKRD
jgi:hypothetical protein